MQKRERKSTKIALGGLSAALCLVTMFMTGIIPFGEYTFPALAGIILIGVAEENGLSTATMVYVVVSILALFIVPVKESVILFIFFFGYYPVVQRKLVKIKFKLFQYLAKFAIFNAGVISAYWVVINIFGLAEILEEFGPFGQYSVLILLVLGNVFFAVYDFTVDNVHFIYLSWFKPRFLKRLG